MLSEAEMRKKFADGFDFPPLQIRLGERNALLQENDDLDAILSVSADDQSFEFAVEFKPRNSPRIFEEALAAIQRAAQRRPQPRCRPQPHPGCHRGRRPGISRG